MRRACLLTCVSLLLSLTALGRPPDSTRLVHQVGLKLHQGFVLVHSRDVRPMRNSYPTGLALDFAWQKVSERAWNACHCYPRLGFSLTGWNYGHDDILGQGVTGMFFIEPLFGAWRKVSFSIRAAFGLSYQNRPYDARRNPDNRSYSTFVAFPLQLGGSAHIRLGPQWTLDISALYNHFSNGGIREPNAGVNWPTMAIGLGHYLQAPRFQNRTRYDWRENATPQTRIDLVFFMGFQEPRSKMYLFSPGFELKYSRQVTRLSALTAGGEWLVDNGARYLQEVAGKSNDWNKGGIALGHEFLLGKVLFSQQFGVYVYNKIPGSADVYQRYGLTYRLLPRLQAGISLKAHGHVADFLDFRIGFSL